MPHVRDRGPEHRVRESAVPVRPGDQQIRTLLANDPGDLRGGFPMPQPHRRADAALDEFARESFQRLEVLAALAVLALLAQPAAPPAPRPRPAKPLCPRPAL